MKKNYRQRLIILSLACCGLFTLIVPAVACGQTTVESGKDTAALAGQHAHRKQVYLLMHEFVYVVTADMYGETFSVLLVKDGPSHFTAWVPDSNSNTIYATAFLTDTSGHFVTSRYAVEPWNNANDQSLLKSCFSKELGLPEFDIHISGITKRITLKNGDIKEAAMVQPNPYPGMQQAGWLLGQGQQVAATLANAAAKQTGTVKMVNPPTRVGIYGYMPRSLADTLAEPVLNIVGVTSLNNTAMGLQQQAAALPEGAPVFNTQGAFVGVYSAANRKTPADEPVFYPLKLNQ